MNKEQISNIMASIALAIFLFVVLSYIFNWQVFHEAFIIGMIFVIISMYLDRKFRQDLNKKNKK
jgi:uncharacterized membrane protein YjjP (DUF1212 family)